MNEEHDLRVLEQFLQTSKQYLMMPIEREPSQSTRRSKGHALIRTFPPRRSIDRREQTNFVWVFAGRHRFP